MPDMIIGVLIIVAVIMAGAGFCVLQRRAQRRMLGYRPTNKKARREHRKLLQ